MNLENKENLSNYQLLKRKPSLCSTSLPFNKLITVVQFFNSRDTDSAMVSLKFWRGKFSRPATGYECIAHAQTFDRGVVGTTAVTRMVKWFCWSAFCTNNFRTRNRQEESIKFYHLPRDPDVQASYTRILQTTGINWHSQGRSYLYANTQLRT